MFDPVIDQDSLPKRRLPLVFLAICALGMLGFGLAACSISFAGHKLADSETEPAYIAPATDADGVVDAAKDAYEAHAMLFKETDYPSAFTCQACHEDHFREWSVSQHAYAQISPIFNAMQATVTKRTNGTNGDFCIRCHTQVGMALDEPTHMSNMDRAQTSREGVTCISCHRMANEFGTASGRLAIHRGPLTDPVQGPTGGAGLQEVLDDKMRNRVVTNLDDTGRKIHGEVREFFRMTEPEFCGSCHDVTLFNGFRLEEAFTEFKHSQAAQEGLTCQSCHMSQTPGKPGGRRIGHAAVVAGKPTRKRKISNHYFAGPDHSVVHPLIFPFNADVYGRWSMRQMISFDVKAGWGEDAFEDQIESGKLKVNFPKPWDSVDERYEARHFVSVNQDLLKWADTQRHALLKEGYLKPRIFGVKRDGEIAFSIETGNGTTGHSVPTGFTAERVTWLHVKVVDATGKTLFVSGDTDPNGDLRDEHSLYVHNGELPRDPFLLSLQSKFLVRLNRGGESEEILPINHSIDPLPFVRPSRFSSTLTGRPQGTRLEKRGVPNGTKIDARYRIDGQKLIGAKWPLKIVAELKAGMVPVHLVDEIKGVGFDYNMSAREVGDAVHKGQMVVWKSEHILKPQASSFVSKAASSD